MPLDYRLLDSRSVAELSKGRVVAVVPVGSIEQHCDSPLALDALIAERIAWLACQKLEETGAGLCLILPTLYYGFSPEWSRVSGTLTLSAATFLSVIREIAESLARSGFRRVAVINGHSSNSGLVKAALYEASAELGIKAVAIDYWRLSGIKLDHGGRVERAVARALGIPAGSGDCPRVRYREGALVEPPEEPVVIDSESSEPGLEDVVEPV
ncbi:MAG: creatininase family protein, partial [Acidilobaceae archaeon]